VIVDSAVFGSLRLFGRCFLDQALNRGSLRWRSARPSGHLIEQRLAGLALDDKVGNSVGMPFVGVAGFPNAALELYATALLNNVRGLVCCRVKIG
jgi:hypothetical protein